MVDKIKSKLKKSGKITFSSLFADEMSKPEMIATFLAVLEMIKLSKIHAENDETTNQLVLVKGALTDSTGGTNE